MARLAKRPDAGVSDDRLACHHPDRTATQISEGSKIQSTSTPRTTEISYEFLSRISNAFSNK